MASRDDLRAVAPEFESTTDAIVDRFLAMAARRMNAEAWGDLYADGCIYLAAHLLTLRARQTSGTAGAGPITAQTTGDESVNYGAVVGVLSNDASMATTAYGVEWLNMRRQLLPGAMVV